TNRPSTTGPLGGVSHIARAAPGALDRRKNWATTRPLQASSRHLRKTSLGQEIERAELDSTEPALAVCEKVLTTDEGALAFIQIIEELTTITIWPTRNLMTARTDSAWPSIA